MSLPRAAVPRDEDDDNEVVVARQREEDEMFALDPDELRERRARRAVTMNPARLRQERQHIDRWIRRCRRLHL